MDKKYIIGVLLAGAFAGLLIWSLEMKRQSAPSRSSSHSLQVVTSFYPLYFFTSQIGGEMVDVSNITPAGAEPHEYEPTAQDVAKIERSDLLVLNGIGLEAWAEKMRKNIDPKNTLVIVAGEGLASQRVVEDGEEIADPHVWLSPPLAAQMVEKIEAGLVEKDPQNALFYHANAEALKTRLLQLDADYEKGLAACKEKDIITSHAAFGYLASAYRLNQVPIAGLSPDAEPLPQELVKVAAFAKEHHVQYIFFESLVSPKFSQAIATEVGAQVLVLNPIEGLTNDEIAQGRDYFGEMQENLAHLKIALQCAL